MTKGNPRSASRRITESLSGNSLYFILDDSICQDRDPLELAQSVLASGVRMMQARFKELARPALIKLLGDLRRLCDDTGCILIVNDDPDLADSCGADGVHVGPEDTPPHSIRSMYSDLIIGCSARDVGTALRLQDDGADYIGCGAMFPSLTKTDAPVVGPGRLSEIAGALDIPVIGIGGITAGNFGEVLAAGATGICSIAPFADCDDPGLLAAKFRRDNS